MLIRSNPCPRWADRRALVADVTIACLIAVNVFLVMFVVARLG